MSRRLLILCFGVASYAFSMASLLYAVGFIGGFLTPTQLDGPRRESLATALIVDLGLLALFAVQHSVMARPAFKRWLTRHVPATIERSIYCLLSSLALLLLFWQWQPLGGIVWEVNDPVAKAAIFALYAAGWMLTVSTTFLISHFDLFGLRQSWLAFQGKPYTSPEFVTPWPYRFVRHPLYIGWLTVFWATPTMTASHLLFALGMAAYILAAIRWEERDLVDAHPEYAVYRQRVPMLVPGVKRVQLMFTKTHSTISISETLETQET